jgi:hypothetical protein
LFLFLWEDVFRWLVGLGKHHTEDMLVKNFGLYIASIFSIDFGRR